MKVMSYNIELYDKNDGWDGRDPEKVISTIRNNDPDIVGLQEVNQIVEKNWLGITTKNDGWNDYLSALTSNGYTQIKGTDSGGSYAIRQDIFFKTSRYTKVDSGTVFLKNAASSLNVPNDENADESLDTRGDKGRSFVWAVLRDKQTGKDILVVNIHLHYGGTGSGHEEDDKLRRYEIRTLLAWLDTKSYTNVIVLGDMNSDYSSGQGKVNMRVYTDEGGFEMTCKSAIIKEDIEGTLAITGRTVRPEWIFDYVLLRGNVKATYYTVVDNPVDTGGKYPSDHIPVLAKVYCY